MSIKAKILITIAVLVFIIGIGFFAVPSLIVKTGKSCNVDNECVLVDPGCCPNCSPGKAMNSKSAEIIEVLKKIKCKFIESFCLTQACRPNCWNAKPVCQNNQCIIKYNLDCGAFCNFFAADKKEVKRCAEFFDITSEQLKEKCKCKKMKWPISSDDYIFLDQHTHISGEGKCMGPMIDFPTYSFNSEKGILSGMIKFEINKDLKVIYGSGRSLSGTAGGGAATGLTGIYEMPYSYQGRNVNLQVLEIYGAEKDGTIYFKYKGHELTLSPGEKWEETKTRVEGECKKTVTDKIINYGILDKNKIHPWSH